MTRWKLKKNKEGNWAVFGDLIKTRKDLYQFKDWVNRLGVTPEIKTLIKSKVARVLIPKSRDFRDWDGKYGR